MHNYPYYYNLFTEWPGFSRCKSGNLVFLTHSHLNSCCQITFLRSWMKPQADDTAFLITSTYETFQSNPMQSHILLKPSSFLRLQNLGNLWWGKYCWLRITSPPWFLFLHSLQSLWFSRGFVGSEGLIPSEYCRCLKRTLFWVLLWVPQRLALRICGWLFGMGDACSWWLLMTYLKAPDAQCPHPLEVTPHLLGASLLKWYMIRSPDKSTHTWNTVGLASLLSKLGNGNFFSTRHFGQSLTSRLFFSVSDNSLCQLLAEL